MKPQLNIRIGMLTFALFISAIISFVTTTLLFQEYVHPDLWETNIFDLAGVIICLVCYLLLVRQQVKKHKNGELV